MKTVYYEKYGVAVSDYDISDFVDKIMEEDGDEIRISTALVIDEIRARIRENRIGINDIQIIVDDVPFNIDKYGKSDDWQPCLETWDNITMRLLR